MKSNLLLVLFLLVAAASNGCQEMEPASKEAPAAKLADDMSTRPATRRWFWWGGDAAPAPGGTAAPAAPAATAPPAAQG